MYLSLFWQNKGRLLLDLKSHNLTAEWIKESEVFVIYLHNAPVNSVNLILWEVSEGVCWELVFLAMPPIITLAKEDIYIFTSFQPILYRIAIIQYRMNLSELGALII